MLKNHVAVALRERNSKYSDNEEEGEIHRELCCRGPAIRQRKARTSVLHNRSLRDKP